MRGFTLPLPLTCITSFDHMVTSLALDHVSPFPFCILAFPAELHVLLFLFLDSLWERKHRVLTDFVYLVIPSSVHFFFLYLWIKVLYAHTPQAHSSTDRHLDWFCFVAIVSSIAKTGCASLSGMGWCTILLGHTWSGGSVIPGIPSVVKFFIMVMLIYIFTIRE